MKSSETKDPGLASNPPALRPKKPPASWIRTPRRRARHLFTRQARPALNRFLAKYSEVGDPVVFPPKTFAWETTLTDHWESIRDEALNVLQIRDEIPTFQAISPNQKRITSGDQWKTFWLRGFGHRSEACCQLCPTTDQVLDEVPGVVTAFFSILAPGSHIVAHRGVTKGMINCHLGLVVPDEREACRIQVGPEAFFWEPGELRIFDDTNKHEVWNDTDQDRIVLMIQFERPLRTPGAHVRDLLFSLLKLTPYVRRARKNQRQFEDLLATRLTE